MNRQIRRLICYFGFAALLILFAGLSVSNSAAFIGQSTSSFPHDFNWIEAASPTESNLNAVDMLSATDGWAIGENGALLHFDGIDWIAANLPVTNTLASLSMSSTDNGWILGKDSTSTTMSQFLLRWNGLQWEPFPFPSPAWPSYMRDISAPDDIHLWVAGGVLVCSGDPPDCVPEAAFGTISHWDGSTWIDTSISNVQFSSISMVSNTNGWAVGTEVVPVTHQQRSSIWHWDGTQWQDFPHPTIVYQAGSMHYILEEVAALDVATAWAATTGLNTFLRWNGSTWSLVNSPIGGRPSIAVNTPGDAWAVGDQGVIVHWDGAAWTRVPSPIGETLTGVSTSSVSDAWAVGRDGHILHGIGFQRYLPLIQK